MILFLNRLQTNLRKTAFGARQTDEAINAGFCKVVRKMIKNQYEASRVSPPLPVVTYRHFDVAKGFCRSILP